MATRSLRLGPEISAAVDAFAPLANAGRARIVSQIEPSAAAATDAGAVRHLITNLLDNAVKYGPPGQTITVGCRQETDRVRLWVEDEGPGIPQSDLERVWQPFVRLEHQSASVATGTGLGLAVVRQLAGAMGGRAWVENLPVRGARFVVTIPSGADFTTEAQRTQRTASLLLFFSVLSVPLW
jgi:signal transduction histidine kinase